MDINVEDNFLGLFGQESSKFYSP